MHGEIVLVMGIPASGKSTVTKEFLSKGYSWLNRDAFGGSLDGIAAETDKLLAGGVRFVVLDNTYGTVQSRASAIAVAKKHGVAIRAVVMDTTTEQAQFNAARRMIQRYGRLLSAAEVKTHPEAKRDPNAFPPVAISAYVKHYQPPTVAEGFDRVESRHFDFFLGPEYGNKAVIFDFDGTLRLCKSGAKYPNDPADVVPAYPGIPAKLAALDGQGYLLLGATNQSGVADGRVSLAQMQACISRTWDLIDRRIDTVACTHPAGPPQCWCQKPLPGMGVVLIERYKLNPADCTYVGDMTKDKTFAARCGFKFAWAHEFFGAAQPAAMGG